MDELNIGDFIDKDIVTHFKKNKKSYDVQRTKPTEEQLQEAIKETKKGFKEQYKSQFTFHLNNREFYKDKLGADVILIATPKGKPRTATNGNPFYFCDCPLMKSDILVFFNNEGDLEEETLYLLRGKISIRYRDTGNKDNGIDETTYLNRKGASSLEDLDINEYERQFTFNLWDIITRGK